MQIQVVTGDITKFPSDAIVNAAKASLLGGSGVDGAIHAAAGPRLLEECRTLGGADTGESKITKAYNITTAKCIIHTVGPIYAQYSPEEAARLLASCYVTSLDLANKEKLKTITFPAISTGIYGYPLKEATNVAVGAIQNWAKENPDASIETVYLIAWLPEDHSVIETVVNAKL